MVIVLYKSTKKWTSISSFLQKLQNQLNRSLQCTNQQIYVDCLLIWSWFSSSGVPVVINPKEKLSMIIINKCPECYKIATTNVTIHLRGRPNMSTRVVFKVVYSCKEPWCEEFFALNSMWEVPVRADNFRNTREDLEPATTKGLLHTCPKCLSTSTKFECFKLFHTKVTTAKCWGCAHGEQIGESGDGK